MKPPHEPLLDEFLEACGCAGALDLLVEANEGNIVDRLQLLQPFAVVGSHSANDVTFDDQQVSPRHAYLQVLAGALFCLDLNSQTGTHWPDGPRPFGWANSNQSLRLGSCILRLPEGKS